jgi:hypothetical protein
VVSDVLVSEVVPRGAKPATILVALARSRDATSSDTTRAEWLETAGAMSGVGTTALEVGGAQRGCAQH